MRSLLKQSTAVVVMLLWASCLLRSQVVFNSPRPGDVYREYTRNMNGQDYLQVPDPNIDLSLYPTVAPYIPAPPIDIWIGDLSGAIRAEAMIVFIGGHVSTVGQKLRWNNNEWVDVPLLDTSNGIPAGHHGYNYMMLHNMTMDIPLSWLHEGTNYFQGTSGSQADPVWGWGWGQWGWYGMMVRIYYGPNKSHATCAISSHSSGGTMSDSATISASVTSGSAKQIDFLAYYDDYDTDGDGIYAAYHHDYMMVNGQSELYIKNHVGTASSAPWSVTWNTDWVPDQPAGQVKLLARIKDANDVWYVTPEVKELSLVRSGHSVKLYKPLDVPECCWVRLDVRNGTEQVHFDIPSSDKLGDATAAHYYIRLWNGLNVASEDPGLSEYRHFNNWSEDRFGADHHYTADTRTVPVSALQSGTNTWEWYTSVNLHHGIEILWPGPALAVRYTGDYASPVPGKVTLAYPPDNFAAQGDSVTLSWHPGLAASSYDVQVATDAQFSILAAFKEGVKDTSIQFAPLPGQTMYYWRVRSVNQAGHTDFSPDWSFHTMVSVPMPVTLVIPANDSSILGDTVLFSWRGGSPEIQQYKLEIGWDSTFASVIVDSAVVDTCKVVGPLTIYHIYSWRVAAKNAAGWGPYSQTRRFMLFYPDGIRDLLEIPADFTLSQNYPNPFNPATVIRFGLSKRAHVLLMVYNTLGQVVAELVSGEMEAGFHEISFLGANLPTGVYYCRIVADKFSETKKLLLLK
jgi:hypothetical protein